MTYKTLADLQAAQRQRELLERIASAVEWEAPKTRSAAERAADVERRRALRDGSYRKQIITTYDRLIAEGESRPSRQAVADAIEVSGRTIGRVMERLGLQWPPSSWPAE